jgi:hypothetical protein
MYEFQECWTIGLGGEQLDMVVSFLESVHEQGLFYLVGELGPAFLSRGVAEQG